MRFIPPEILRSGQGLFSQLHPWQQISIEAALGCSLLFLSLGALWAFWPENSKMDSFWLGGFAVLMLLTCLLFMGFSYANIGGWEKGVAVVVAFTALMASGAISLLTSLPVLLSGKNKRSWKQWPWMALGLLVLGISVAALSSLLNVQPS